MDLKKATVNPDVRVIVKKKANKFKGSKQQLVKEQSSEAQKAEGIWIAPRKNNGTVYKPIWHVWGNQKPDPRGNIGLFHNQNVFGNDKRGYEWIEEQKRRQQENIFEPGSINQIHEQSSAEDQIIYIEPSVSEAKLKKLRLMGRVFTDEDFPPNESSLTGLDGPEARWSQLKWRRASLAMQNEKIFQGKIEPNDIIQGSLGDCYFLAGLAALAERPDRIFELFLLKEKNEMNYFSVKILYRGKWRAIDVDDYFPFENNEPAFSQTRSNELWVLVLEKAWAKIYGSYKQIEAGYPEEALHDLTGAPVKKIYLNYEIQKMLQQWQYLLQASKKQYAMVASSKPGSDSNRSAIGIYQGHAYTFLNATELMVRGERRKVVQIRNPWGGGQFKGRFSDGDPVWNEVSREEKDRIRFMNRSDGVFFMDFFDFIQEFRTLTIAEINDVASYVYDSYYDPEIKGAYFTVNVLKPGKYSFQVDKTPERSFTGEKQSRYNYPQGWLEVGELLDRNKVRRLPGLITRRRTLYRSFDLTPGKYVAWVRVKFDPAFEEDFEINLAIYSQFAAGIKLSSREEAIFFQEGDSGIEWTGQRRKKPPISKLRSNDSRNNSYYQNSRFSDRDRNQFSNQNSYQFKKDRPDRFEKAERDNKGGISNLSPNSHLNKESSNLNAKPESNSMRQESSGRESSGMKRKKIRTIEIHHTKVEITEENEQGEGVVTVEQKETRKQILKSPQEDGSEDIKEKEQEKKIDSTQYTLNGESLNKREKLTETLKIKQKKPNGQTMEKVETQEHETEILEVDDDSDPSQMSWIRDEKRYIQEEKKIEQNPGMKSRSMNQGSMSQTWMKEASSRMNKNDELRYQESDNESQN